MTTILVVLTIVEIALVLGVLAAYVIAITREARSISTTLGRVAFGVRAVDSQTSVIGPSVVRINQTLAEIEEALGPIAQKAEQAASRR